MDNGSAAIAIHQAARDRDRRHLWHPWTPLAEADDRAGLMFDHGQGYWVWDTDGNAYIDGISSALSAVCGYAHPDVTAAITQQLTRLHHFDLSRGSHEAAGLLAERLASYLPPALSRTLFVNSGSEGFDAAILIALSYWAHIGVPRTRVVTFAAGYHGATLLSRALSGLPRVGHPFTDPLPVTRIDLPVSSAAARQPQSLPSLLGAFEQAIGDDCDDLPAAVVVEPFLNVGGGVVLPPGFLRGLRELCDETGTLLVLDEVFTAYGRCGQMFACVGEGAEPDILVTSKGLSSGYVPIAAVTVRQDIYQSFGRDPVLGGIRYGHTNSGHGLACAAALATLDVLEREDLAARAGRLGQRLLGRLTSLTGTGPVIDVRGIGLAVVLEMLSGDAANYLVAQAQQRGLLLRRQGPQGQAILVAPPLVIDARGIDLIADRIEESLAELTAAGPSSARQSPVFEGSLT